MTFRLAHRMVILPLFLGFGTGLSIAPPAGATDPVLPVPDAPFPQEITRRLTFDTPNPPAGAHLAFLNPRGEPRFFAGGRWWTPSSNSMTELPHLRNEDAGAFTFPGADDQPVTAPIPWAEVLQILPDGPATWVVTSRDPLRVMNGQVQSPGWPSRMEVRQLALDPEGRPWVASSGGLFRRDSRGWVPIGIPDGQGRGWAVEDVHGVAFAPGGTLWVALPAGVAVRSANSWRFFEGADGLPYNDFTGLATAPDGAVWFATRIGAIRLDSDGWHYRQGPRWLPHDEVRSIVIDPAGTAWFATAGGAGAIERVPMTLARKAELYEREIENHIVRTPHGYTSEVHLAAPGDRSRITAADSDNDGLWTSMYGAGQCFAFAATGRLEFKERAGRVFDALKFLQDVTQGTAHSPPAGYVARTIRPVEWPDPNQGRAESDRRHRETRDRLWKVIEPRWPLSADGRWFWKGDTSSDELDGHYFFHARYYDLVADDTERERVREVVRRLTDHLIAHDFCLVDHDGAPTRWAVFSPARLNQDPDWIVERGLNSLSILSYLAVAEHITGDRKYADAARDLIDRHGYAANVMVPKLQTGFGSGNQSDDEMAFMCFYNLLAYSGESGWREHWLRAFHAYAALELPEMNPFFNFAFAATGRGAVFRSPWGSFPLEPWEGWLADSLTTLREFPLDRVNWPHRNSHRLDLVPLPPQQAREPHEHSSPPRGYRVSGRVLSVAERHFNHWNTDPWRLDYGGDGRELASGTVFLLPYYMGLHHRFIAAP